MPSFNDIDLKRWKDSDIHTDSLWLINKRDNRGKHSGFYHGNFVPQIPNQLIRRYTKKNEIVFDPFVGSGTTAFEAEFLQRDFIGIDIQDELLQVVRSKVEPKSCFSKLICGDSTSEDTFKLVNTYLHEQGRNRVQFAILHPPYADIVKFSDHNQDLSNASTLNDFLKQFSEVVKNTISILDKDRYLAVVIGDQYKNGQWVPLGFYCMQEVQKLELTLKSIIIKNMEGNRAKQNKEGIWRYRALTSDYYIFKHEYIFIFKN